ncbi:MAG: hypothetical protein Tsb002_36020 [Wenzhouxiangellaceae bacterium]
MLLSASAIGKQTTTIEADYSLKRQGTDFSITHYTIDAGYQEMSGGGITLRGIIGQHDTGISQGNNTVFVGGFLEAGAPLLSEFVFRDGFEARSQQP